MATDYALYKTDFIIIGIQNILVGCRTLSKKLLIISYSLVKAGKFPLQIRTTLLVLLIHLCDSVLWIFFLKE